MEDDPPLKTFTIVDRAIQVAVNVHAGQVDKQGVPYIHHPLRVLELVRLMGGSEIAQAVAVLHDVKEDGEPMWREKDFLLGALGGHDADFRDRVDQMFIDRGKEAPSKVPREVCALVDLMTHIKGTPYRLYVQALAVHPDTRLAKWADSTDNWARLGGLSEQDEARMKAKYEQNFVDLGETEHQHMIRLLHQLTQGRLFLIAPTKDA